MLIDLLLAALIAGVASAVLCPLVIAAGVFDTPDAERKTHDKPTPTSGGLAIAAGCAIALAAACLRPDAYWSAHLDGESILRLGLAIAFAFAALAIGALDDVVSLSARLKFGLLTLLAFGAAVFVARAEVLPVAGDMAVRLGVVFGVLGSALWVFTLVNSTNFMDGANGLSMGSTAISLCGLVILATMADAPGAAMLAAVGAGALVGFLIWNFPRGRLFAGDAGALFAGMLAAMAALLAIDEGGVSPFKMALLFLPTLADVLLTLLWRARKGRPLLEAHNDHLFQIGLRIGISHARLAIMYWGATLLCVLICVSAAYMTKNYPPDLSVDGSGPVAWMMQIVVLIAAMPVKIALACLALIALIVSNRVRRYAEAKGVAV